jgi:hypothetical protein
MPVALGLIVLPAAVANFFVPLLVPGEAARSGPWIVIVLAAFVVFFVGFLSLTRLATTESEQIGKAIAHAGVRAIAFIAAVVILFVGIVLVAAMLAAYSAADPVKAQEVAIGAVLILILILSPVLGRIALTAPVAASEAGGPFRIIARSWALTRGHTLRLLGAFLLAIFALVILEIAVGFASLMIAVLVFGPVDSLSASKLFIALAIGILRGIEVTLVAVMLARIYVQLSGREVASVSAPRSGI